eukprot:g4273.t1
MKHNEEERELSLHGATTLHELFENSVRNAPHVPFYGRRYITPSGSLEECSYQNYREVELLVRRKVDFYCKRNLGKGSRIGIYGRNSPEWMQTAMACDNISAVSVPFNVTFTSAELRHVIRDSELSLIAVQDEYLNALVEAIDGMRPEEHKCLIGVDVWSSRMDFESLDESVTRRLVQRGIAVTRWMEPHGIMVSRDKTLPTPEDVCSLVYCRDAHGLRGLEFTHRSILSTIDSLVKWKARSEKQSSSTSQKKVRMVSTVPLYSIAGRVMESMVMATNGVICYWQDNGDSIFENIAAFEPNFLAADAAALETIRARVLDYVDSLGQVFRYLYDLGMVFHSKNLHVGATSAIAAVLNATVFQRIRNHFRFKFETCFCLDETLKTEVRDFVRHVLSAKVKRSFGSNELNGLITIGDCAMHRTPNWIGSVIPELEFRLISSSADDDGSSIGELCIRGSTLFYRDHQSDKENAGEISIDAEGWYHTGKRVEVLSDGSLVLLKHESVDERTML